MQALSQLSYTPGEALYYSDLRDEMQTPDSA